MAIDEKINRHEKCIECLKKQKECFLWENKYVIWELSEFVEYIKIKKVINTNSSQIAFICDKLSIYKDKFEFANNCKCTYNKLYLKSISKVDYDEKIHEMIKLMTK